MQGQNHRRGLGRLDMNRGKEDTSIGHKDIRRGKGRDARAVAEEREGDSKKSERGARTIPEQRESFKYITQEGKGMKDSIKEKGG